MFLLCLKIVLIFVVRIIHLLGKKDISNEQLILILNHPLEKCELYVKTQTNKQNKHSQYFTVISEWFSTTFDFKTQSFHLQGVVGEKGSKGEMVSRVTFIVIARKTWAAAWGHARRNRKVWLLTWSTKLLPRWQLQLCVFLFILF